ncbi:YciI family protein [Mycolicibacterium lacusdiani]|uniref:YciI family protein n=1 Tax=Mycolicibacterium lacusdiani TaxID=2895283 RepID=UPI001F187D88|nr:YciI family protein [Mycolicibacterium lacusdiani]
MFHVLTLTYVQPLDVVDQTRPAHLEWIDGEIASGRLILAGRQESGAGGVLVTGDITAEEADDLIANDPYQLAGLVDYERVGFNAGKRAPGL